MTGAEYKRGSGKDRQLYGFGKYGFHRFFDFEKISYGKYIINDIYDDPLEINDDRAIGNNSVYSVFIELILMHHLSQKGITHVETFMKKDLWKMLGMINDGYIRLTDEDLYNINPMFTKFEVKDFYMRTNQKLEKITQTALNNLKKRCLIEWELLTIIHTHENNIDKWITANDDQKKDILKAKRQILNEFGMDNMFQVYASNKHNSYFNAVNNLLHQWHGWDYYFQKYKVIFDAKNIIDAIPQTEINLNRALLNEKVITYINNDAINNFNRSQKKYNDRINEANNDNELWVAIHSSRLPENYVMAQSLLADELLRIDNNSYNNISILEQSIDLEAEKEEINQFFATHLLDFDDFTLYKDKI